MRIAIRQHVPGNARLSETAFRSRIGQEMPVTVNRVTVGKGVLVGADVAHDGRSVDLALDLPERATTWVVAGAHLSEETLAAEAMSIGLDLPPVSPA